MLVPKQPSPAGAPVVAAAPLRVLIIDDHRTFAELLAMALDSQPDIICVGHAQDDGDALEQVRLLSPDVVLVDVHLGDSDGLEVATRLLADRPDLRVIVLTASSAALDVARAAAVGACAYLVKSGALTEVLGAIRTARSGELRLPPKLVLDLVSLERRATARGNPGSRGPALTGREQQVLDLLGEGLGVTVISRRLGIRPSTCRGYVQNVLAKLGVHTQLEAVVKATGLGMLRGGGAPAGQPAGDRARR